MSAETTEETLARHERQIAALKAGLRELLVDLATAALVGGPDEWDRLSKRCNDTYRLLDSDE